MINNSNQFLTEEERLRLEKIEKENHEREQIEAREALEDYLIGCGDSVSSVNDAISIWKSDFGIDNLEDFFTNPDILADVENLIEAAYEEAKRREEEARIVLLNVIEQQMAFRRLDRILTEAKNYKDYDKYVEKLNSWLKDHPDNTWNRFDSLKESYFKKFANEKHLAFITGKAEQDEILNSLKNIVDYSISYSNYDFYRENIDIWNTNYAWKIDSILSSDQQEYVKRLLEEANKKLIPEIENPNKEVSTNLGNTLYLEISTLLSGSSSQDRSKVLLPWLAKNANLFNKLNETDFNNISALISERFNLDIPKNISLSIGNIQDSEISDIRKNTILYFMYKMQNHTFSPDDIAIFEASALRSEGEIAEEQVKENKDDSDNVLAISNIMESGTIVNTANQSIDTNLNIAPKEVNNNTTSNPNSTSTGGGSVNKGTNHLEDATIPQTKLSLLNSIEPSEEDEKKKKNEGPDLITNVIVEDKKPQISVIPEEAPIPKDDKVHVIEDSNRTEKIEEKDESIKEEIVVLPDAKENTKIEDANEITIVQPEDKETKEEVVYENPENSNQSQEKNDEQDLTSASAQDEQIRTVHQKLSRHLETAAIISAFGNSRRNKKNKNTAPDKQISEHVRTTRSRFRNRDIS